MPGAPRRRGGWGQPRGRCGFVALPWRVLVFQAVQGHRPSKASWFALTWHTLDRMAGYDAGADKTFRRSAYEDGEPLNLRVEPS